MSLNQEKQDVRAQLETVPIRRGARQFKLFLQTERTRRQAEVDAQDARDMANQLQQQNAGLLANKRKVEGECAAMHVG
jgi:hypothetical protein